MCLGYSGEGKRGFFIYVHKCCLKDLLEEPFASLHWWSPAWTSPKKHHHSHHLSSSPPGKYQGKKGAFPTSLYEHEESRQTLQKLRLGREMSKRWSRQWLRATLQIIRLKLLDMEAGAKATWNSWEQCPFEMCQVCKGVGWASSAVTEAGRWRNSRNKAGSQTGA